MNRIKSLREEKGWSQSKLAQKLGVKTPVVSKYESEDVKLTEKILRKLSETFKCSIDYILCNDTPFDNEIFNGEELRLIFGYRKLESQQQKALLTLLDTMRLPKSQNVNNMFQSNTGDQCFFAVGNGNKYVSGI